MSIIPNDRWGGEGFLGAEVGCGVLHRLPAACQETNGRTVGTLFVPPETKAATDAYGTCVASFIACFKTL